MTSNITVNNKDALAFNSTLNHTLDLYTWQHKLLPTEQDKFNDLINTVENSFINNPTLTIKLLKYKRLINKGEGLRMLPFVMMLLLKKQDYEVYKNMLEWFRTSDKDLLRLARMARMYLNYVDNLELELYVDNLYNSFVDILNGVDKVNLLPIKYLPSNGNHFEKERQYIRDLLNMKLILNKSKLNLSTTDYKNDNQKFLVELLVNQFNQTNMFINNKVLRQIKSYFDSKQFLATPLLKHQHLNRQPFGYLGSADADMEKEYEMICDYLSKLSTQAFNNVKKHIEKSDNNYLTKGLEKYNLMVQSKPEKVKTNGLVLTDQLYNVFLGKQQFDSVLEAQVNKQAQELKDYLSLQELKDYLSLQDNNFVNNLLVVIDISGSMAGTPLNTALYHTLLLWIAFDLPSVLLFSGNTQHLMLPKNVSTENKIKFLYRYTNGSTNLESVFEYMIKMNIKNKHLLIFTDGDCDYCFEKSSSYTNNPFHLYLNKIDSNICVFNLKQDKLCFPYLCEDPRTCYLGGNNMKVLVGFTKALSESILTGQPITPTSILLHSLNLEELEHNYNFKYLNKLSENDKEKLFNTVKYNLPFNKSGKDLVNDSTDDSNNLNDSNNSDDGSDSTDDDTFAQENNNLNTFVGYLKNMI